MVDKKPSQLVLDETGRNLSGPVMELILSLDSEKPNIRQIYGEYTPDIGSDISNGGKNELEDLKRENEQLKSKISELESRCEDLQRILYETSDDENEVEPDILEEGE